MNKRKISLYIYTLLIVVGTNTAVDSSKIMAYASSIMTVNNVDGKMVLQESKVSNIEDYTIDASWTVISEADTAAQSLDQVINSYIASGERKFYIKDGNYKLNGSLNLNSAGIIIQGQSKENTKITQNDTNSDCIDITADSVEVWSLNIDSSQGKIAVTSKDSNNIKLENCIINGSSANPAVAFFGKTNGDVETNDLSDGNIIEGNTISAQLSGSEKDGVIFTKQKNGLVTNNNLTGSRMAFYLSRNSEVSHNTITSSETNGIRCTVPAYDNTIAYNTIQDTLGSGISLVRNNPGTDIVNDPGCTLPTYRASNINITNNNITGSRYFGIEISNLKDSNISNNTINKVDLDGIYLLYADSLDINGNTINDSGLSTVNGNMWGWNENLNSGIFADYMVSNCTLDSNQIDNKISTCINGIRVQSGNSNFNNKIINNSVLEKFLNGIVANEGNPENTIINGNTINLECQEVPPNIKTVAAEKSITLSWDAVPNALGYEIEVDGNAVVDNGTNISYEHTGLESGIAHSYRIRSKGGNWSDAITATTLFPAPSNIIAVAGENDMKLSWDAETGVSGYEIEVDGTVVDNGTSTSYDNTGLLSGASHNYRVRAKGGAWSEVVSSTTLFSAPSNIKAVSGANEVNLSWDAEAGASGYEVEVDGTVVDNGTSTSYDNTGLFSRTSHNYRVRAKGGVWSEVVAATTLFPAPSNITAVAGENDIKLSWDAETGVSGYEIEVDGTVVDNGTSTSYDNTGLLSGTSHNYRVRAKGGAWSEVVSSTTLFSAPSNIKVVAGENDIKLSWDAETGVSGYEVEVDGTVVDSGTSTGYDNTGLFSGTTHNYRVRAKGGEWSDVITAKTLVPPPPPVIIPAPSNIKVVAGENDIKLSWDAGTGVSGYEVEVDGTVVDNGTNTSYDNTGLTSGTSHNYRVRAKGGEWSDVITAKTLVPPPPPVIIPAPSNIKVVAGENDIKLSWDAGTGVSGYEVEVDGTVVDNGTNTSYDNTGLTSGTSHNYRVRAKGGEWSDVITAKTLVPPPPPVIIPAPSNIKVVAGESDIKLSWDAETGVSGYEVEVDGTVVDNGTSTSYDNTGLTSGTSHNYRVRAKGGEWSDAITAKTLVPPPPVIIPAPSNIKVVAGESDIKLSWDAETGGSGYEIEVDGTVVDNGTSTSYDNTGLTSGTSHNYRVRAKGGEWSDVITAKTLVPPPPPVIIPAPSNIKVVAEESDIKLSWDAEAGVSGYDIEVDGKLVDNGTNTSYDNTGLTSGTSHNYRVRAKGGEWSNVITAKTLVPPPPPVIIPAPSNIKVVAGESDIKLSWDAETGVSGYEIEVDGKLVDNGTNTSYDNTGLTSGTSHNYRVRAKGGEWSDVITAKTLVPPPPPVIIPAPSNIKVVAGESDIKLSWDAETGVSGYEVEVDGTVVDNGTNTSYDNTGLLSGTTHNYRVRAKGGEWSNVITVAVLSQPQAILNPVETVSKVTIITAASNNMKSASENSQITADNLPEMKKVAENPNVNIGETNKLTKSTVKNKKYAKKDTKFNIINYIRKIGLLKIIVGGLVIFLVATGICIKFFGPIK